jgi:hypothetical protein
LILSLSAGASERRFKLALAEPDIRVGQVLEITAQMTAVLCVTNTTGRERDEKNVYPSVDFKGRFKILSWDESWRISRTEITVERLLEGDGSTTNALLETGTVVLCNFVAGNSYYKLPTGQLTRKANAALEEIAGFGPGGTNLNRASKAMRLTEPRKVGELWEGDPVPEAQDLEDSLGERPDPKTMAVSARFNQVTNRFGVDCFDLEERYRAAGACPKYRLLFRVCPLAKNSRIEIEGTRRYVHPFERGLPCFFSDSFSAQVSAEADEGRADVRLYLSGTGTREVKLLLPAEEGGRQPL